MGQAEGIVGEFCAGGVGLILTGTRDRHLQQHRRDRTKQGDDEEDDGVGAALPVVPRAPMTAPQRARFMSTVSAPAMVAATELMRMSRLRTCDSS